jgi:hypothetical protein
MPDAPSLVWKHYDRYRGITTERSYAMRYLGDTHAEIYPRLLRGIRTDKAQRHGPSLPDVEWQRRVYSCNCPSQ